MVIVFNPTTASKAWNAIIFTVFGIIVFLHPLIKVLVAVSIIALQSPLLS